MKYLLIYISSFFLLQDSFGQISGKVTASDGQPIQFASVTLLKSIDSTTVKVTLTDAKGMFTIDQVDSGKYILRVSSIGYQTWISPVFELSSDHLTKDFGTLIINQVSKQLGEVVIRSDRPLVQQEPGGLVVNVQSSIMTKGSSVLQVLERSPGVVINPRDNSITLNGKSGVMVMLDGKLMRMSMTQLTALLDDMSADNIDKIELLNTPPAKYDAEGNAGLINIVTKKNKRSGTNGSVTATAGYGKGAKASAGINLNHNAGKVNLYGSYSYSGDRGYYNLLANGTEDVGAIGGQTSFQYNGTGKPASDYNSARLGADVQLDKGTTIGGSLDYTAGFNQSHSNNHGVYALRPDSVLLFNSYINGAIHSRDIIGSVYLDKEFSKNENLRMDADYIVYKNYGPTEVQSSFIDNHGNEVGAGDSLYSPRQRDLANTLIQVGVVTTDYMKQLNPKWKLETGVKGTYTKTSSTSGIENLVNNNWMLSSVGISSNLVTREVIGAAYATSNLQIDTSSSIVFGARYEYSHNSTDKNVGPLYIVYRKLGKLFPSVFYSKKLGDHSSLALSYTNRISRPSYSELASYVTYNDPVSVFTGNPALKPTVTHNLRMDYNFHNYLFSLLLSRDDNPILSTQVATGPTKGIVYLSPQNAAWQKNITLQVNIPIKITDWWNMSYNIIAGPHQYRVDYTPVPFEKTYFSGSVNFTETFKLPKQLSLEVSGYYNTSSYYGTSAISGNGALNAGIKKELNNNGGSFQLSVADILTSAHYSSYIGNLTRDAFSSKVYVDFKGESSYTPIVRLSYFKSFGTATTKNSRRDDNSAKDEKDRL
ncbi:MAG TPA: outer membrane beta-barrel protein, partial [Mucilaginibacter sp.]